MIFAGAGGETSDRNVVRNNAIPYSSPRWNIEGSGSDEQPGVGNVAHDNCVYSPGRRLRLSGRLSGAPAP